MPYLKQRPSKAARVTALAAAVALALLAAAVGYAAIPSSGGVFSACKKSDGSIKLIDRDAGQTCPNSQQLVEWNKQGPAGPSDPASAGFLERFGTGTGGAARASGAPCTLGEILLTASQGMTAGGVPADGRLLLIADNDALFSLLGDTYGGDGQETFAVPDLRAITPDHMTYSICDYGIWPQP